MIVPRLSLLVLILVAGGCASSPYYVDEERPLRSARTLECPDGSVSVCVERSGELVNCRCERTDQLGTIY